MFEISHVCLQLFFLGRCTLLFLFYLAVVSVCACEGKRDSVKRWKNKFLNCRFAPFYLSLSSVTFLYPREDKEDDNITVIRQHCTSMEGNISQWNTHAHDLWSHVADDFWFLKLKIHCDTDACCVGSLLSIARLFSNMQLGII